MLFCLRLGSSIRIRNLLQLKTAGFIVTTPLDIRTGFRYGHHMVFTAEKSDLYNPKAGEEALPEMSANVGRVYPTPQRKERERRDKNIVKIPLPHFLL